MLLFVQGINEWREEGEWSLARAVEENFYLQRSRGLSTALPPEDGGLDEYVFDPSDPVPATGGAVFMSPEYQAGQLDQSVVEMRDDVLVYTGLELTADLEVTGRVRAVLHASTDGETTDWVVRLCDVDENGVSRNVTDGVLRASTKPGAITEFDVDMWSTSYVFRAGHRLRVQITSSNFPRWNINPNSDDSDNPRQARQRIFRSTKRPSRIILPIVPPGE